jgi:hypothetical protein
VLLVYKDQLALKVLQVMMEQQVQQDHKEIREHKVQQACKA